MRSATAPLREGEVSVSGDGCSAVCAQVFRFLTLRGRGFEIFFPGENDFSGAVAGTCIPAHELCCASCADARAA